MSEIKRSALLFTGALLLAPAVYSQEPAPAQSGASLEEVVVTAQRRTERLVDVPISVSTASAEQLNQAGVNNVADLAQAVSGLRLDFTGPFTQPTIRGIGSSLSGTGIAGNVAIYVDGFYRPNQTSSDIELIDVESVQVLKGPQGSLFGRNATGGAILITTRDPAFDEIVGDVRLGVGSHGERKAAAFVSLPVLDTLAVSLTAFGRNKDGWVDNVVTGNDDAELRQVALRNKWLWAPSDRAEVTFIYEHLNVSDPRGLVHSVYRGQSDAALLAPGAVIASRHGDVSNDEPGKSTSKSDAWHLKFELDLGPVLFSSASGYRKEKNQVVLDLDGSSAPLLAADFCYEQEVLTQEFNLQSNDDGPLDWVLGAFYYHDDTAQPDFSIAAGGGPMATFLTGFNNSEAWALYGDATYEVLPYTYLTLGGRYGRDEGESGFRTLPDFAANEGSKEWSNFSPRVVLRHELNVDSSIYISYTEGYKAGQFNTAGLSTEPVDPEEISAWEVGYKTSLQGLQIELAAFHYSYEELQVSSYRGPVAVLQNAAESRIFGADLHLFAPLTDRLSIDFGVTYLDSEYESFPDAPRYAWSPLTGMSITPADASGNRGIRAPRWSGNATVNYEMPLFGGRLNLSGNAYAQSRVYFDSFETLGEGTYAIVNARAEWTEPGERYSVALWGRNLTDTEYLTSIQEQTLFFAQLYGEPVSGGVEFSLRF